MISKVINGKEYLFVEVQPNSYDYAIKGNTLEWWKTTGGAYCHRDLKKDSKYQIIGKASELTEEQWKGIAEGMDDDLGGYKDYQFNGRLIRPKNSGLSLIASLNLKPETTLIIQKI